MPTAARTVKPFYLDISDDERAELQDAVGEILASGQLVLGPRTEAFEAEFASYVGVEHAVSVSTGTAALEIIFRAKNIENKRIAVPTNTNFATVAAIMHAGGIPVMLDMDPETYVPTAAMLEAAHAEAPLAGAVWVHIGGLVAPDFDDAIAFCRANGLFMVEDAAHAHGSETPAGKAGALGDAGAFSFFPTKVMTTLEGGMITTNDAHVAAKARSFRNQGKGGAKFGNDHTDLGNSWRLNEFGAAMGSVQLRKLDEMVARREHGVHALTPKLEELGLHWCKIDHMTRFSGYKLIVRIPEGESRSTAELKAAFKELGVIIGGGVYDKPCHLQPVFASLGKGSGSFPMAEAWCPRHLCPPITSGTTGDDIDQVADAFAQVFRGGLKG